MSFNPSEYDPTAFAPIFAGSTEDSTQITHKPNGRPTLYRPEYAEQAYGYCLLGATNDRLAQIFDVQPSTISQWLVVEPKFSEAVKKGREIADVQVVKSLYRKATGFKENVTKAVIDKHGNEHQLTSEEYHSPDTAAAFIWLKNRQPKLWRDKHEVEITGKNGGPIELDVTESARLVAFLLAQGARSVAQSTETTQLIEHQSAPDVANEPSQGCAPTSDTPDTSNT